MPRDSRYRVTLYLRQDLTVHRVQAQQAGPGSRDWIPFPIPLEVVSLMDWPAQVLCTIVDTMDQQLWIE